MSNKTIGSLPPLNGALQSDAVMEIENGGQSYRVPVSAFKGEVLAGFVPPALTEAIERLDNAEEAVTEIQATIGETIAAAASAEQAEQARIGAVSARAVAEQIATTVQENIEGVAEAGAAAGEAYRAARLSAAAMFPADFTQFGRFFVSDPSGDPSTVPELVADAVYGWEGVSGEGNILNIFTGANAEKSVFTRNVIKLVAGKRYRAIVRLRARTGTDAPTASIRFAGLNSAFTQIGVMAETLTATLTPDAWGDYEVDVSADSAISAGYVYLRGGVQVLGTYDNYQVAYVNVTDISERYASAASAQAAQDYRDQAGEFASAADVTLVQARLRVSELFPSTFEAGGSYFLSRNINTNLLTDLVDPTGPNGSLAYEDHPSFGHILKQSTPANQSLLHKQALQHEPGRKWRITARFINIGTGAVAYGRIQMNEQNGSGSWPVDNVLCGADNVPSNPGQWVEITRTIGAYGTTGCDWTLDQNTVRFRPQMRVNGGGAPETNICAIQLLLIEDITESSAARSWADASAEHATTAGVHRTEAETAAEAAEQFKLDAQTAEEQASSHATNANTAKVESETARDMSESAASAANTTLLTARATVSQAFPSSFTPADQDFWVTDDTAFPAIGTYPGSYFGGSANPVFITAADSSFILASRGTFVPVAGRKYRATLQIRKIQNVTDGRLARHYLGFRYNDGALQYAGLGPIDGAAMPLNTWQTHSYEWTAPAGVAWARTRLHWNWDDEGAGNYSNGRWEIRSFLFEDITDSKAAESHANAAFQSYEAAEAQAGIAEGHASAAQGHAGTASYWNDQAESHAEFAEEQKAVATAQAAVATAFAGISASVAKASINRNPNFGAWPDGNPYPTDWQYWAANGGATISRTPSSKGGYATRVWSPFDHSGGDDANSVGIMQHFSNSPAMAAGNFRSGWYVIEAEIYQHNNSLGGAGVLLQVWDASDNYVDGGSIEFFSDPNNNTSAAIGHGIVQTTWRFSKLIQITSPNATKGILYAMGNWSGFTSAPRYAKVLDFLSCSVRAATAEEVALRKPGTGLYAQVSQQSGVVATHDGKLQAYLQQVVSAGSSSGAVRLVADNLAGSMLELQADAIRLGSGLQPAMSVVGGNVIFHGRVLANTIETMHLVAGSVTTPILNDLNVTTGKIANNAINDVTSATLSTAVAIPPFNRVRILSILKDKRTPASILSLLVTMFASTNDDLNGDIYVTSNSTHQEVQYDFEGNPYYTNVPNYQYVVPLTMRGPGNDLAYPVTFGIDVAGWPAGVEIWNVDYHNKGGNFVNTAYMRAGSVIRNAEVMK